MNEISRTKLKSREEWLEARKSTIGGSDAAAVIGLNPYKSNVDLWEEKTNGAEQEDISNKPYVKYGTEAEPFLRELFKLDYPEYEVFYEEDNIWHNDEMPWAHYSADGWLKDKNGRLGLLEIKTTNILQSMTKEKWKDRIPDNYYVQILHGMLVTGAVFVVLKAQLKTVFNGETYLQTKHYLVEREAVVNDLEYLLNAERNFYELMKKKERPALILPSL